MNLFTSFLNARNASPTQVEVAEAKRRQDQGAVLIDVRETSEWQAGHAPGARLIPLGMLSGRLNDVPSDREVLLICQSGNRSGAALQLLLRQGFDKVFNVSGGMGAWSRAGLPVER